eukprot:gene5657-7043_t
MTDRNSQNHKEYQNEFQDEDDGGDELQEDNQSPQEQQNLGGLCSKKKCKNRKVFPEVVGKSNFQNSPIDFSLQSYILYQKLDRIQIPAFLGPLKVLETYYTQEIQCLDSECQSQLKILDRLFNKIHHFRPFENGEVDAKRNQLLSIFTVVKAYQKTNSCNVVLQVLKKFAREYKSRRILNEEQENNMNTWFDNHLPNPYPDEDEKAILGSINNLSKSQIDNWMGNKRIRFKTLNKRQREDGIEDTTMIPTQK